MSYGEIQQIYDLLIKISEELNSIESRTGKVEQKVKTFSGRGSDLKEIEYIFYRVTSIMRRMGLPEDIDKAITTLQHLLLTIRILTTALYFLQTAEGPYGWAMALVGISSALVSSSAMMNMEMGR